MIKKGDNYRIYGLIIIKIAKKLLMLNYGLSNATFETPNHVLPISQSKQITLQLRLCNHFSRNACSKKTHAL